MSFEIDLVAAGVHSGWMAVKRAQGITSRKAEDGEELMVPWSVLSERQREMDRMTVRSVLESIDALGFEVTRRRPAPPE